jgi:hypothetical protein
MSATRPVFAGLLIGIALGASPVSAHHSFAAEYDADQPITLSGDVLQVDLVNPHAWLYIGSNTVNSRTITLDNGEPLFSGSRNTGAPE